MISHNDDSPLKDNILAKVNIASHRQMIKFNDVRGRGKARQVLGNLFEMVSKFDNGNRRKLALRIQNQLTMRQGVQVRLDQEQVRARLYWQEARPRYIDAMSIGKVFDGCPDGSFQLDDFSARLFNHLVIDNDFQIEGSRFKDSLDGASGDPNVVGIENFEFLDGSEIGLVGRGNLGNFQELNFPVVINDGATFDVSLGLVRNFHDEFGVAVNQVLQDVQVNSGAEIVNIRNKQVFNPFIDQIIKQSRIVERFENITVA